MNDNRYRNQSIASFTLMVMVLGIFIVLITLFLVEDKFKEIAYSNFGSFVNGITAPIIGVIVGLLTFLAFKMQVEANRQVQKQFELQQFESQFYELLRLHKENVNEMVIQGYVYEVGNKIEREVKGRKIFVSNITEFITLLQIINNYINHIGKDRFLKKIGEKNIIKIAYNIFFFGLDSFERHVNNELNPITKKTISLNRKKHFIGLMSVIRQFQEEHKLGKKQLPISVQGMSTDKIKLYFNYKPYSGHLSRYGHYYRNLILIVKHVVDNNELKLTYKKKREYLRILRAQLTS